MSLSKEDKAAGISIGTLIAATALFGMNFGLPVFVTVLGAGLVAHHFYQKS